MREEYKIEEGTLLGFVCLAVILAVMSFAACAQQAAGPTATVTVTAPGSTVTVTAPAGTVTATPAPTAAQAANPTFTVLDPRSTMAPIPYVALNPRLTTLTGKKIGVVNLMGGNEAALTTVPAAVMKLVPGVTCDYFAGVDIAGSNAAAYAAFLKAHDAIILGNAY